MMKKLASVWIHPHKPNISPVQSSFVDIEFMGTSTPIAPRKRCRTRGGHSSFNPNYLPPQPRQLLPQPQPQRLCSTSISNKPPLCTPSKQPKPCSSNWEIDFHSEQINDSILLQDIVDTAPLNNPPCPITPSNNPRPLPPIKINNKYIKLNRTDISMNSSPDISSPHQPHIPGFLYLTVLMILRGMIITEIIENLYLLVHLESRLTWMILHALFLS